MRDSKRRGLHTIIYPKPYVDGFYSCLTCHRWLEVRNGVVIGTYPVKCKPAQAG